VSRHARPETGESDDELAGVSILLVDDESDTREVVAAQLQESGATVLTAESVTRALELLQREHVDVLLADIGMPGEDGYSLIRRVRALPQASMAAIPAAALTALARKEDRQQALQAGFQMHLTKPVDSKVLVTAIATLNRLNLT
jgi:CheY-like chemotaxis protein